jgi:PIN domain nuclease of toxin-antitoxin system
VNLLVDTHALIWFVSGDRRIGRAARAAMEADGARLHLSAASMWEMAIKSSARRLELPQPVARYVADRVAEGYLVLSVDATHAAAVEDLPWHHRDPFDRLLIAQARIERMPIISRDRIFRKYGVDVIW